MANKSRRTLQFAEFYPILVVGIAPNPALFAQGPTSPSTGGAAAGNGSGGLGPGRLLGDLGRNSVALISKSNIAPLFLGAPRPGKTDLWRGRPYFHPRPGRSVSA